MSELNDSLVLGAIATPRLDPHHQLLVTPQPLGNAHLASVAIYSQQVPAFEALLRQQGNDLGRFYAVVRELAALPAAERNQRLAALAPLL